MGSQLKSVRVYLSALLSLVMIAEAPLAFAGPGQVVHDVGGQLKRIAGTKAAFCFAVENGAVTGVNENELVRTASVTKVLTTFWMIEGHRGGLNYQYPTKIYIQPSTHEMHIEGSRDPFFDRDRVFALLSDLNIKKMTHLNRLTVDTNFWVWPQATDFRYMGKQAHGARKRHGVFRKAIHHIVRRRHHGRHPSSITPYPYRIGQQPFSHWAESEMHTDKTVAGDTNLVKSNLTAAFNTDHWSADLKSRYQRSRAANPGHFLPQVKMSTAAVDVVLPQNNPLKGKPGVFEFVVFSAPIKIYLKFMNIYSVNPYAEEMFFSMGGKQGFISFMQQRHHMGGAVSNMNSGSGVNLHGPNRFDTTVSCSTVVKVIRQLDHDLEAAGYDLSDVMSVPANDGGTWKSGGDSLVVKTGTLTKPTGAKNLAGVEETTSGEVYFGIFIDRRGGNSGSVRNALSAMQRNFRPSRVNERQYAFTPLGQWSHMKIISPVSVAKK